MIFKYSYLKLVIAFNLFLYIALGSSLREYNFLEWSAVQSIPYFFFLFSFLSPIFFILIFKGLKPNEKMVSGYFNYYRYIEGDLGLMDAISDHYTNIATIGVFFTVFIYTSTKLIANFNTGFEGPVIAFVYILLILLYIPYALRFLFYVNDLKSCKVKRFLIVFSVFFFDSCLIQVFIETAPTFISQKIENESIPKVICLDNM